MLSAARTLIVAAVVFLVAGVVAAIDAHSVAGAGASNTLLLQAQAPTATAVVFFVLAGVAGVGLVVLWGVTEIVNQSLAIQDRSRSDLPRS